MSRTIRLDRFTAADRRRMAERRLSRLAAFDRKSNTLAAFGIRYASASYMASRLPFTRTNII